MTRKEAIAKRIQNSYVWKYYANAEKYLTFDEIYFICTKHDSKCPKEIYEEVIETCASEIRRAENDILDLPISQRPRGGVGSWLLYDIKDILWELALEEELEKAYESTLAVAVEGDL